MAHMCNFVPAVAFTGAPVLGASANASPSTVAKRRGGSGWGS
jgi:hypothetical protein